MTFRVLHLCPSSEAEFVHFWTARYSYRLEHLYEQNIRKPLTPDRVWSLFRWKNGSNAISKLKQQSITSSYIPQLHRTPKLRDQHEARDYVSSLGGGPIWGIFWLHCIVPDVYPIFDQHTYRAMAKIETLPQPELPQKKEKIFETYFSQFMPFIARFSVRGRQLDKALFSYGRFLKAWSS